MVCQDFVGCLVIICPHFSRAKFNTLLHIIEGDNGDIKLLREKVGMLDHGNGLIGFCQAKVGAHAGSFTDSLALGARHLEEINRAEELPTLSCEG